MIRSAAWLFVLLLLVSCAGNTPSLPVLYSPADMQQSCQPLFPRGSYQYVHLIEFTLPGGQHGNAMGVTVIRGRAIDVTLMTVEGFVLFAGSFETTLTVSRAVPPFDKPGFAAGMLEDIRTIFLQPQGEQLAGRLADGSPLCRIVAPDGLVTDSICAPDSCCRLNIYAADQRLLRTVTGQGCSSAPGGTVIPENLHLQSMEAGGYSLEMTLISSEPLS